MNNKLPFLAEQLLKIVLPENSSEFLLGDITDLYNSKINEKGKFYANLWCYLTVFLNLPGFVKSSFNWGTTMFLKDLKISIRQIFRQKLFSAINIFCLTMSLIATIFIWLWINDELSYDKFHKDADSIFRLEAELHFDDKTDIWGSTPQLLGKEIVNEFSQVTNFVTLHKKWGSLIKYKNEFAKTDFCYFSTDEISELFDIKLLLGESLKNLNDPKSIFLSKKMSDKLFDDKNPIGEIITLNNKQELIVKGVFENLPSNSHLDMECLVSLNLLTPSTDWGRYDFYNYFFWVSFLSVF